MMIEQFEPWYFGIAVAFCCKYCTGMPDMPLFSQKPRYRRKEGAPRIWTRAEGKRIRDAVAHLGGDEIDILIERLRECLTGG